MITYKLRLDSSIDNGYKYFPNGDKIGGELFPTLRLIKNSLEFPYE